MFVNMCVWKCFLSVKYVCEYECMEMFFECEVCLCECSLTPNEVCNHLSYVMEIILQGEF